MYCVYLFSCVPPPTVLYSYIRRHVCLMCISSSYFDSPVPYIYARLLYSSCIPPFRLTVPYIYMPKNNKKIDLLFLGHQRKVLIHFTIASANTKDSLKCYMCVQYSHKQHRLCFCLKSFFYKFLLHTSNAIRDFYRKYITV